MKRKLSGEKQKKNTPLPKITAHDFADPLTDWLWRFGFTDLRALLAYHATCRRLWRDYADRDLELLETQWRAKLDHHASCGSDWGLSCNSLANHNRLWSMVVLARVHRRINQSLRYIPLRFLADFETVTQLNVKKNNPFNNTFKLFPLHELGMHPERKTRYSAGNYAPCSMSNFGIFVLRIACIRVSMRLGWNFKIREEGYLRSFGESSFYYDDILVACQREISV